MKPLLPKGTHKKILVKLYSRNDLNYWITEWRCMKIFNNIGD